MRARTLRRWFASKEQLKARKRRLRRLLHRTAIEVLEPLHMMHALTATVEDVTAQEAETTTYAVLTVTLSAPQATPTTFNYMTEGITA
jgi:hypothetical protein